MNASDSFFVPFSDAGRLAALKGGPLGPRFRFWRDCDGRRHVFSVYAPQEAPDYPDALALVARRTPAGPIAMWAGPPGEEARAAAARLEADEIHIHVFGEDPPKSLTDFAAEGRAPQHSAMGDPFTAVTASPLRALPVSQPSRRHAA